MIVITAQFTNFMARDFDKEKRPHIVIKYLIQKCYFILYMYKLNHYMLHLILSIFF